MTAEKEENGKRTDQMLGEMVRDADEYYSKLKVQRVSKTRVQAAVTGVVVWFAVFVAFGLGVYFNVPKDSVTGYLLWAFLTAVASGIVTTVILYVTRVRKRLQFADLGVLLDKMKGGQVSSEDGLRLVDLMHSAVLTMRKQRLDSAFGYGVAAFILVSVIGFNTGFGALAGVIVYLYLRFEAMRDFEKEEARYDTSKREVLQSL